MRRSSRLVTALALGLCLVATPRSGRTENLQDAWAIALGVNQGLQSQQALSSSAGMSLGAARSARLPTVRTFTFNAFLTASPATRTSALTGSSAAAAGAAGGGLASAVPGAMAGLPATFPVLGAGQQDLPVSLTFASIPLYTGGRILRGIDAASARVGAQRSEEFRTALELKLTVAEAYVSVLRARRDLEVARSNVSRLASFARDVTNRREQGMAIRSDELAAQVSLANARLGEIEARNSLESACATYNRYLDRPLWEPVALEELAVLPPARDWKDLAEQAVRQGSGLAAVDEEEMRGLTVRAIQARPELAGLVEQARAYGAQADATRAGIRPQVSLMVTYAFIGSQNLTPQGIGSATFLADWTLTDGGASRRRAGALRQQEFAALKRRADVAADVALQVRTRWLDLSQARQRVPVARLAIAQSEENVNVVQDRYRQQLSTYTEVLDAENRRVQSLSNFYHAVYDESLALFRLRRAVGDL